jgi:hypothetical protein
LNVNRKTTAFSEDLSAAFCMMKTLLMQHSEKHPHETFIPKAIFERVTSGGETGV